MSTDIDLDRARAFALIEAHKVIAALYVTGWKKFDEKGEINSLTQRFLGFLTQDRADGADTVLREAVLTAEIIRLGGYLKANDAADRAEQCKAEMQSTRILSRMEDNLQMLLKVQAEPVVSKKTQGSTMTLEGWLSGLKQHGANVPRVQILRGFESHSFRQLRNIYG